MPNHTSSNDDLYQSRNSASDLSKRIKSKCADGDIRAALRLLTAEDTFAAQSDETLRVLRSKHPPGSFMAMPSVIGAGLDGLRPRHFQDKISRDTSENVRHLHASLCKLANRLLAGRVPEFALGAIDSASLCALVRKMEV